MSAGEWTDADDAELLKVEDEVVGMWAVAERLTSRFERIEAIEESRPDGSIPGITTRLDDVLSVLRLMHGNVRRALGEARSS